MRLMRKQVKAAGARIIDHSPALELLVDDGGTVCGATGVNRQSGDDLGGARGRSGHRHRRLRLPEPRAGLQRA